MMVAADIASQRLTNQRIAGGRFDRPGEAAAWLGALQAQDARGVKWAIGLRCKGLTEAGIEAAIRDGSIIRSWLMRGTLHVAAPGDARWMLALLGPRIIASSARRYRQLELDERVFAGSFAALRRALGGGTALSRAETLQALERAGISTQGQRGYHILRRAGLEGLICFGPAWDRGESFVLLDEWAPGGEALDRRESLAELARRYFQSHGPATLQDFAWWSGLTVSDARLGLELAGDGLSQAEIDGEAYWRASGDPARAARPPAVELLPAFDEYYLGYRDRSAMLEPRFDKSVVSSNGVFRPMIVVDGRVAGTWRAARVKGRVTITPSLFEALSEAENQALGAAAERYGAFLGLTAILAPAKPF